MWLYFLGFKRWWYITSNIATVGVTITLMIHVTLLQLTVLLLASGVCLFKYDTWSFLADGFNCWLVLISLLLPFVLSAVSITGLCLVYF